MSLCFGVIIASGCNAYKLFKKEKEKERKTILFYFKKLLEVIITTIFPPSFFQFFTKCGFCPFHCPLHMHTHKIMEPKVINLLLLQHTQVLDKCMTNLPTTKGRFIKQENWESILTWQQPKGLITKGSLKKKIGVYTLFDNDHPFGHSHVEVNRCMHGYTSHLCFLSSSKPQQNNKPNYSIIIEDRFSWRSTREWDISIFFNASSTSPSMGGGINILGGEWVVHMG